MKLTMTKEGKEPGDIKWTGKCSACKAEYEILEKDIPINEIYISDPVNYAHTGCQFCGRVSSVKLTEE